MILPIICAEGEKRQIGSVLHVTDLEILETIADSDRFLDLRTYDGDGVKVLDCLWVEVKGEMAEKDEEKMSLSIKLCMTDRKALQMLG